MLDHPSFVADRALAVGCFVGLQNRFEGFVGRDVRRMPPPQAVELQHERLVFLRRGVASRGVWLLAGRIDAQPVIAEPGRHALLAHQTAGSLASGSSRPMLTRTVSR